MSDLSSIERLKFEALFGMESGYVLDFSNTTFSTFTIENVGVNIFDSKYEYGSSSKANRLRKFLLEEPNEVVGKLLSALLDYWLVKKQIRGDELSSKEETLYEECQKIVNRLNRNSFRQTQENTLSPLQKGRIFISYRRVDSEGYAGRIYDRLVLHFGDDAIFMDVDDIPAGVDFIKYLENEVQSCNVLIALIGKQWLNVEDEHGLRRLDNPNDFVRIEIATALKRDIRVIPVLLGGTQLPNVSDLPENLQSLTRRNGILVYHHSFHADTTRLIKHLEDALRTAEKERQQIAKEKADREAAKKAAKEKAERVAADKVAKEKAEMDAAEKARLKAEEEERQRIAKEIADREAVEKTTREKAEKEAAEKTRLKAKDEIIDVDEDILDKLPPPSDNMAPPPDNFPDDWEAQWQSGFVKASKDEKVNLEISEKEIAETTDTKVEKPSTKKKQLIRKPNIAVIVGLIGFAGFAIVLLWINSWRVPKFTPIVPTANPSTTITFIAPTKNYTPTVTRTSSNTPTITPTFTATITLAPTTLFPIIVDLPVNCVYTISDREEDSDFSKIAGRFEVTVEDIVGIDGRLISHSVGRMILIKNTRTYICSIKGGFPIEVQFSNNVEMLLVISGEFAIGEHNASAYLDNFYIDKYEVTNALYKTCVEAGICKLPVAVEHYNDLKYINHPVVNIDWQMAQSYCEWRGARLPTDEEWEKAASWDIILKQKYIYPWGNEINESFANYNNSVGDTTAVGSYETGKSPSGVYDMVGNVWEWVSSSENNYSFDPRDNIRGGSWENDNELNLRTYSRGYVNNQNETKNSVGFRCMMNDIQTTIPPTQ